VEKQRGVKSLSIVALLIAIVGLTVAFAAMNRTLTINNTTATIKAWNIHFKAYDNSDDVKFFDNGNSNTVDDSTISLTENTISGISVVFNETGTKAYYTFKIHNEGNTNAAISNVTYGDRNSGVLYSVTYGDGVQAAPSNKNDVESAFGPQLQESANALKYKLYYGDATVSVPQVKTEVLAGDVIAKDTYIDVFLEISLGDVNAIDRIEQDLTFSGIAASIDFQQTSSSASRTTVSS